MAGEQENAVDPRCGRCRHPESEHDESRHFGIKPCGWTSIDYSASQGIGIHCTCFAFTLDRSEPPALSEIGRQMDVLSAKIAKIGHDGLHSEACRKCAQVARLSDRLSYLGGA